MQITANLRTVQCTYLHSYSTYSTVVDISIKGKCFVGVLVTLCSFVRVASFPVPKPGNEAFVRDTQCNLTRYQHCAYLPNHDTVCDAEWSHQREIQCPKQRGSQEHTPTKIERESNHDVVITV